MTSSKQVWTYKPLSDRRRQEENRKEIFITSSGRTEPVTRASGSADPGRPRSCVTSIKVQRSSSLIYNQDLLSSQIKDFLQRTDRSSRERWRSKSRSIDIPSRDVERRCSRSSVLSLNSFCNEASVSSRENSIWEEGEELSEGGTEGDDALSSISSDKSVPAVRHSLPILTCAKSEKYIKLNQNGSQGNRICQSSWTLDGINGKNENNEPDLGAIRRYENLKRQFHITKQKLNQQHDAEMDQILSLKKQLEKKLYDAYESLDEQKQLVIQWKKKFTKLTSDYSEVRLQLDDQLSQKSLIDKKRRKEESDFQYLMDELNQEQKRSDKLFKDKELIIQEKGQLEESITDLRMEIQTKTMEIKSLTEEINTSKSDISELELENLKKTNNKLKKTCVNLEEELEKNLRQIDTMEDAKHKMEQNVERLKIEHKQEISQRQDEIDELRYNLEKKMKALQCQLEQENHEKTVLMKEKYKLERQIDDLQESVSQSQSSTTSLLDKMKNKLIKTKALLKDERSKEQVVTKENNKLLLRKLKNQLDGVELEKLTAIKSKQKYEMEYADLSKSLADMEKSKHDAERKLEEAFIEIKNQQKIIDDKEEEMSQIIIRFASTTQQLAENQNVIQEMTEKISNLETDNASLTIQIASLQVKLDNQESLQTSSSKLQAENHKAKIKELESKSELDKAMISRREQQLSQLGLQLEKAISENDKAQNMLKTTAREVKSYSRQINDLQDETKKLTQRENDLLMRNKDLAMKIEVGETEKSMLVAELRIANDRIAKLRSAIDDTTSYYSDSTESEDDSTLSMVTMDDFKRRSQTPDSISSGLSDFTESKKGMDLSKTNHN